MTYDQNGENQWNLRLNEEKSVYFFLAKKVTDKASLKLKEIDLNCGNFEVKESQKIG